MPLFSLSWIIGRPGGTVSRSRDYRFMNLMAYNPVFLSAVSLLLLAGCGNTVYSLGDTPDDPALYAKIFPYYIETCAVSAMKRTHGPGFKYQGGAGGHAVVYLNGVCRDAGSSYPSVHMCGDGEHIGGNSGVGPSSNGHFSNAAWIATPCGRGKFFFDARFPGHSAKASP